MFYCLGFRRNSRLEGKLDLVFDDLQARFEAGALGLPVRQFVEFESRTLSSWSCSRRVIGKAEVLTKRQPTGFIVINFEAEAFGAHAL